MAVARRIAILGWGSLLWDPDTLAPHVTGGWLHRHGPRLPMEFSRVSPKRKMGLVLCLDPQAGASCATHAIRSTRPALEDTIADLARREHAPGHRIGWAEAGGEGRSRLPQIVQLASHWCAQSGWDAAVWTDLEPNFIDHTGSAFNVAAGIAYLQALTGDSLHEAHRYIRNAPATTRTPLRRALARDPWWRGLKPRPAP